VAEQKVESHLSICVCGKSIPYGARRREDRSVNNGFKALKGRLHDVETIPEAIDDAALRQALSKLNHENTGIFTIGCVSGLVRDQHGHRMTGYIEFTFNYVELIGDAGNYCSITLQVMDRVS
jgi:hypothetical protein